VAPDSARLGRLGLEVDDRRRLGVVSVLVSDLARAVETVVIAFADSDVPVRPLQHLLDGTPLADVVTAPFDWQPGWEWTLA
jgi:hypothetical protein